MKELILIFFDPEAKIKYAGSVEVGGFQTLRYSIHKYINGELPEIEIKET